MAWTRKLHMQIVWIDKFCGFDKASLPSDATMLTVGGYTPRRSRMWLNHFPGGLVVSYEACRATWERELAEPHSRRVKMIHGALSRAGGVTRLHHGETETSHTVFGKGDSIEEVPAYTLAQMLQECGRVGLLYMNCEGAELFAFQDMLAYPELQERIPQVCASFHVGHVSLYPLEQFETIIARMAREYAVIPGRRAQNYFLFVRQQRM